MEPNQRSSSKSTGRLVCLKFSSSSSPNTSHSTPSSSDVSMRFSLVPHRSTLLANELKAKYHQVFKEIPQTPHFHPLANLCDEIIEDVKLGFDVSFIKLVEKLQNPVDISNFLDEVETYTKKLGILENMGYDVSKLRQRLYSLHKTAEEEKSLKKAAHELEEEEREKAAKAESQEFRIKDLEEEARKVEEKVKKAKSSLATQKLNLEKIKMHKRKFMEDATEKEKEFKSFANSPW